MCVCVCVCVYSSSLLNLPPNPHPFLPLHVLTELQAGFPVLYTSLLLAIYFTLDKYCKEIQPVHSERDQPWDFFGRNDAKAETPVLWPPHVKS